MRVSEFMTPWGEVGKKTTRARSTYRAARRNDAKKVCQMVKHKRARSR